jgi:nitrate reductase assembly molybdenum cofactor insertion protein NarJ
MPDDDLEDLRKQTERGTRIETAADEDDLATFRDAIGEHLEAIDAGDKQKTLSAWDGPLAAFVAALEDDPERYDAVADAIAEELDVALEDPKKSELLALTLRVGFQQVAPKEMEALREAVREDATKGL